MIPGSVRHGPPPVSYTHLDVYKRQVEELLEDMDTIMAQSQLYTLEEWNQRPWYRRVFASILKLGAIWL